MTYIAGLAKIPRSILKWILIVANLWLVFIIWVQNGEVAGCSYAVKSRGKLCSLSTFKCISAL